MSGFSVYIQQAVTGDETAVYHTDAHPTFSARVIDAEETGHTALFRFVHFTPTNGYEARKPMTVPIERLVGIVTETPA